MSNRWANNPDWAARAQGDGHSDTGDYAKSGPGAQNSDLQFRKNAYGSIRSAVLDSIRTATQDVQGRVRGIVGRCDNGAIAAVDGALTALSAQTYAKRQPAYLQNPAQWAAQADSALNAKQSMADNAFAGIEADAAAVISAALLAAIPTRPNGVSDYQCSELRADLRAILGAAGPKANAAAAEMLSTAIAAGDDTTIYTLCGADSMAFMKALAISLDGLRLSYISSFGATYQPNGLYASYPRGTGFILAQRDASTSLAGMIAAARTCSDQGLADVRAQILGGRL